MPEDTQQATGNRKNKIFIYIFLIVALVIMLVIGYKTYQVRQAKQAEFHFSKAEMLYSYQKYHEAVTEYELVASKYPHSEYVPASWYNTGYIYFRYIRNDELSAKAFETLLAKYPDNKFIYETMFCLVDVYDRLGKNEALARTTQNLLSKYPNQVNRDSLRIILATALVKLGNIDHAAQVVSQIENKDAPVIKNSQEYYQLLMMKDPTNPQLHYELARIYKGMGLQQKVALELAAADSVKKMNKIASQQKAAEEANAKKAQNIPAKQRVLKPKLKISAREEQLYLNYARALSHLWQETEEYSKKLGQPEKPEEQNAVNVKIKEFTDQYWVNFYKQNNTTVAECGKIIKKINTDKDLAEVLSNKVYTP